ncbi:hypothetical protein BHE74_00004182, partial [Ensete ventricosum]
GLYSDSNRVSVPESLIFFIAYHTAAPHHVVRGPCGEACACRPAFPCRVSHVGGLVVRRREDVVARSIFVISEMIGKKPRRRKQRRVVGDSRCDWKPTDK